MDDHLLRAQRGDLVRELRAAPEREYGFKHVLTQEAAYATLLVLVYAQRKMHGPDRGCTSFAQSTVPRPRVRT